MRSAALFFGFIPFVICSIYLRAEHRELAMIHQFHFHILPCLERKGQKTEENYGGWEELRLGLQGTTPGSSQPHSPHPSLIFLHPGVL